MPDSSDLDRLLPGFDLRSLVALAVPRPPPDAYRALRALRLREVPILLLGLRLRALPARLTRRRGPDLPGFLPIFDGFLRNGFVELADRPGRSYSIGGIAKFWRLTENRPIETLTGAEDFIGFDRPGYVKVASCHLALGDGAGCRILHEIRMAGTSPEATARFARYWRFVALPSRILRISALKATRRNLA